MTARSRAWIRIIVETTLILVVGAAAGIAINAARSEPLPYDLSGSHLLTESGAQIIPPGKARKLFEEGEYVFIDARQSADYIQNHIEAALSLPTARFDALYPELKLWSGGQPLLIYGSEVEVSVADDLARRLMEMGEEKVAILTAGFEAWQTRGYPVEAGADGLLVPEDDQDWDETWDEE